MNKFISPTYGELNMDQVVEKMRGFYDRNKHYECPFNVIIGTDSQNFDTTKMASVLLIQCEGHGGVYFYKIEQVERIQNVIEIAVHLSGGGVCVDVYGRKGVIAGLEHYV